MNLDEAYEIVMEYMDLLSFEKLDALNAYSDFVLYDREVELGESKDE
jgi:hypothetical protein